MKDKQQPMPDYEAPKVEVVEVEIEQGFAISTHININEWEEGGSLGSYDV